MGLVVNTNIAAFNSARVLRQSTLGLRKSLERLSSGLRINRASDDAAGLAIAEGFRAQSRGFAVAQRNVQDGINLVQTAEGALSEIGNIMQRIRELAVQANNGTNSPANKTLLNTEAAELVLAVNDIITRTKFNNIDPFGATAVIIHSGDKGTDTITLKGTGTALTTTTLNINAINLTAVGGPVAAINNIDNGLIALNTRRADLGAAQNRLEFTTNVLAIREENALSSESAIRDANIALETIQFTRNQILVTAGTSLLAQANLIPQTALTLLG